MSFPAEDLRIGEFACRVGVSAAVASGSIEQLRKRLNDDLSIAAREIAHCATA